MHVPLLTRFLYPVKQKTKKNNKCLKQNKSLFKNEQDFTHIDHNQLPFKIIYINIMLLLKSMGVPVKLLIHNCVYDFKW